MQDNMNSIIKRIMGFSIGPVVSAALAFFITPITTWIISPEELGKASMYTLALNLITMIIYLGLDQAFVREYYAQKDKKNLLWNSFIIPLILSIITGLSCFIFYEDISLILFSEIDKTAIYLLGFSIPATLFHRYNLYIFRMEEKAKSYSLMQIAKKIFELVFLLFFLFFIRKDFVGVISSQLIALLSITIITVIYNKKWWFFKFKVNKQLLITLLKFGLPLVPASIFSWLLSSMDKVALRSWSTFYEIGLYTAAFKVANILNIIQIAFSNFWIPTSFKWYENKVPNEKFEKVNKTVSSVFTFLFSILVLSRNLIFLLFDQKYSDASILVPFLLFIPIMYVLSETTVRGIGFARKTWYTVVITLISGGINILGNFILVPRIGSLGAAISTSISYVVFFWLRTLFSRRLWFKFELNHFIVNIILITVMSTSTVLLNNSYLELVFVGLIYLYNHKNLSFIFKAFYKFISTELIKRKKQIQGG